MTTTTTTLSSSSSSAKTFRSFTHFTHKRNISQPLQPKVPKEGDPASSSSQSTTPTSFVSPPTKHVREWDRWDYAFTAASILQFVGFASSDILSLRMLSAGSASLFMVAHNGRRFFVGYFWCFCYLFLNLVAIGTLLLPQMTVEFTNEELDIFEHLFLPYGITPREFKILLAHGKKTVYPRGSFLTLEGEKVGELFLITRGDAVVFRDTDLEEKHAITEIHVGVENGTAEFVGELSFVEKGTLNKDILQLEKQVASASVQAQSELHCIVWDAEELSAMLKQNQIHLHRFHAVLTKSVRGKIQSLNEERMELELDALECMLALIRATGMRNMDSDQADIILEYCEKQGIPQHAIEQALAKFGMKSPSQL